MGAVTFDEIANILVGATLVGAVMFVLVWHRKCPKCHRHLALKRTGSERKYGRSGPQARRQQWRCRHCSHTVWRKKSLAGVGGNGDTGGNGNGNGGE